MPHTSLARRVGFLGSAALVAAVIGFVYAPSLSHEPRADQWAYFLETVGHDRFLDVFAHTYSYDRTAHVVSGDPRLFRPVFFALMALEKTAFSTRFNLCQATGIVLHVMACWLLLTFLRRAFATGNGAFETNVRAALRSPLTFLPLALTLFFAVNFATAEQVIWYSINGYLLALVLLLGSLNLIARAELVPGSAVGALLAGAWFLGLLAAFTYELGQVFALCVALALGGVRLARGKRAAAFGVFAAFAAIVVIYQSANQYDRGLHGGDWHDDIPILRNAWQPHTLERAAHYAVYTEVQPFFPFTCGMQMLSCGKMHVGEEIWDGCMRQTPMLWVSTAVVGLWIGFALLGGLRLLAGANGGALAVTVAALGTALGHVGLIVLGHGDLATNPYYTYTTLLFTLCGGAVCAAWALRPRADYRCPVMQNVTWLLVIGLVVLSVGGGRKVHRLNARIRRGEEGFHAWNNSLRRFVAEHRGEPGFGFAVVPDAAEPMPDSHGLPAPWLFFQRYVRGTSPRYVLSFARGRFVGMPLAQWRRQHADPAPRCFPELVQVGLGYHIFRSDGVFHAVSGTQTMTYLASLGAGDFAMLADGSLCRLVARVESWLERGREP
jgi:hypothetical protein